MMKVIGRRRSLVPGREKFIVEAQQYEGALKNTFMGVLSYSLDKGSRIIIRVKKSEKIQIGSYLRFDYCLSRSLSEIDSMFISSDDALE